MNGLAKLVWALLGIIGAIIGPIQTGEQLRPAVRINAPAPVGDLPGWRLTHVEDFNRPVPLGSFAGSMPDWFAYPYPWHDGGCTGCFGGGFGTYDPARTLSVSDGALNMDLRTEGTEHLVAAVRPAWSSVYGRMAVNWRADLSLEGYQLVIMQWADANFARFGEHDCPELFLGVDARGSCYVHFKSPPAPFPFREAVPNAHIDTDQWHTSVTEWTPGRVAFKLDGRVIGVVNSVYVTDLPMHPVLQVQTSLAHIGPPTSSGRVQIGWVATWEMTG